MTFEELAKLEPRLWTLLEAARVCNPKAEDEIAIWYDVFKPRVVKLVGWGRRRQAGQRDGCSYTIEDAMLLQLVDGKLRCHRCKQKHPKASDAELHTRPEWPLYGHEAYSIVYDRISVALENPSQKRPDELMQLIDKDSAKRTQHRLHGTADKITDELGLVGDACDFVLDCMHELLAAEAQSFADDFKIILAEMRLEESA